MWADPPFFIWGKYHPLEGGPRALCRFPTDAWGIDHARRPPYYAALETFRDLGEFLRRNVHKWAMRSARDFPPPPCENQLGWPEEYRRRLGRRAPASQMMDRDGRAVRVAEPGLRSSIFWEIANGHRAPNG